MDNNFNGPYTNKYVVRDLPKFNLVRSHPNYLQVEENIHVIKNFLSKEQCEWFINIVNNSNENDWTGDDDNGIEIDRSWWHKRILNLNNDQMNDKVVVSIIHKIRSFIDEPSLIIRNELTAIHRLFPGENMFQHCDNPIYEDYEINDNEINNVNLGLQYAIILYLNDFEGGETYYPNLGLSYKAEMGDALWHPGNKKYSHGVKNVSGDKIRYITTTYITDKNIRQKNNEIVGWDRLNR